MKNSDIQNAREAKQGKSAAGKNEKLQNARKIKEDTSAAGKFAAHQKSGK